VPRPLPLWALLTNSCQGGGRELGAELAQALPGQRRTRGLEQPATGQHHEAVDLRGGGPSADEKVPEAVEEHLTHAGAVGNGDRRKWDRCQAAVNVKPEPGIAAAARALVGDVDGTSRRDRHTDRPGRCHRRLIVRMS
jgi:hypothetical protein